MTFPNVPLPRTLRNSKFSNVYERIKLLGLVCDLLLDLSNLMKAWLSFDQYLFVLSCVINVFIHCLDLHTIAVNLFNITRPGLHFHHPYTRLPSQAVQETRFPLEEASAAPERHEDQRRGQAGDCSGFTLPWRANQDLLLSRTVVCCGRARTGLGTASNSGSQDRFDGAGREPAAGHQCSGRPRPADPPRTGAGRGRGGGSAVVRVGRSGLDCGSAQ